MKLFSVAGETFTLKNKKPSNNKNLMLLQLLYILVIQEKETPIAVGVMSIDSNVFIQMKWLHMVLCVWLYIYMTAY